MLLSPAVLDLQSEKSNLRGCKRGDYIALSLISIKNPVREKGVSVLVEGRNLG